MNPQMNKWKVECIMRYLQRLQLPLHKILNNGKREKINFTVVKVGRQHLNQDTKVNGTGNEMN